MELEYPRIAEWIIDSWVGWVWLLVATISVLLFVCQFLCWACLIVARSSASEIKGASACPCCKSRYEHDCCCGCFPACERTCPECASCATHCKCTANKEDGAPRSEEINA